MSTSLPRLRSRGVLGTVSPAPEEAGMTAAIAVR